MRQVCDSNATGRAKGSVVVVRPWPTDCRRKAMWTGRRGNGEMGTDGRHWQGWGIQIGLACLLSEDDVLASIRSYGSAAQHDSRDG